MHRPARSGGTGSAVTDDPIAPRARLTTTTLTAGFAFALLSVVWSWWASKEGAYFGAVMYPGIILLCVGTALVVSRRTALGAGLERSTMVRASVWALLGLGAWSALSALWSPAPNIALADAQRILAYGLAFVLGIWLCVLLGRRMHLAMAPLALAGLFAGLYATAGLLTGEDIGRYLDKGTLEYPLGYRNANAAFFLIAMWPALGLALMRELDWRLRGLALGTTTLCLELGLLSQSRGSTIGAAAALAVFLVVSRDRARGVFWLVLALLPALVVVPALTDLYQAARDVSAAEVADELHAAGLAVVVGTLMATVIGGLVALASRRVVIAPQRLARANRAVGIAALGLAVGGIAVFAISTGDPVDWVSERAEEFRSEPTPDLSGATSRFGLNAGSERYELWRIAAEAVGDDPLLGDGGGGYQYRYLIERGEAGVESVRDAHSIEFEIAAELGLPGLGLFAVTVFGAAAAALRGRRLGPSAAALSACALPAGAYWLTHASIDWFWTYPAVTAPVFALLGAACGPEVLVPNAGRPSRGRRWGVLGAVALAVTVVPPYLSERLVDDATSSWRTDPARAEESLDRARALNPFSDEPSLIEGVIARERGDTAAAIAAFEEAAELRPEEWAPHYFLATLYRQSAPRRATAELEVALALNPLGERIERLHEQLAR